MQTALCHGAIEPAHSRLDGLFGLLTVPLGHGSAEGFDLGSNSCDDQTILVTSTD